jgi:hypothetical protein
MNDKLFILWDPKDGEPQRDKHGAIEASGLLGRITEKNAYLTAYAKYPDARRPADLEVFQRLRGVEYNLSGSKGSYDIIRVA